MKLEQIDKILDSLNPTKKVKKNLKKQKIKNSKQNLELLINDLNEFLKEEERPQKKLNFKNDSLEKIDTDLDDILNPERKTKKPTKKLSTSEINKLFDEVFQSSDVAIKKIIRESDKYEDFMKKQYPKIINSTDKVLFIKDDTDANLAHLLSFEPDEFNDLKEETDELTKGVILKKKIKNLKAFSINMDEEIELLEEDVETILSKEVKKIPSTKKQDTHTLTVELFRKLRNNRIS